MLLKRQLWNVHVGKKKVHVRVFTECFSTGTRKKFSQARPFQRKERASKGCLFRKRADARIKCEQTYEKFMTSKPTQFAIRTYRGMKTVYNIAANQTKASRERRIRIRYGFQRLSL